MQIVVLGPHRSGTSLVTRLINLMGAYFGDDGDAIDAAADNPKGFWERKDVVSANDAILGHFDCAWDSLAGWSFESPAPAVPQALSAVLGEAISRLDVHRPWVIKDPRLCLTLPYWLPHLAQPVRVVVSRDPGEVALSLARRNGVSLGHALAIWEYSAVGILEQGVTLPTIWTSYDAIVESPVDAVASLYANLSRLGGPGLHLPRREDIEAFVDRELHRARTEPGADRALITPHQGDLHAALGGQPATSERRFAVSALSRTAMEAYRDLLRERHFWKRIEDRAAVVEHERPRLEALVVDQRHEIAAASIDLNAVTAARDAAIAESAARQAERDAVIGELVHLRRSLSWRLTSPFRFVKYAVAGNATKVRFIVNSAGRTMYDRLPLSLRGSLDRGKVHALNVTGIQPHSIANFGAIVDIVDERCRSTAGPGCRDPLRAALPADPPAVDVSVVTHNSRKWLVGFVDSVLDLRYPRSKITLRFVDNSSTDDTPDAIRTEVERLQAAGISAGFMSRPNRGYGAGHNAAIAEGTAPFCLVTNVDLTFEPDSLATIVATAAADADGGAWELRQKPYEHPKYYDPVTGTTNWNAHACVLLRRSALAKVGGYDETLFMYGEDVELSYRLRRGGYRLRYCPAAVVFHYSYESPEVVKPTQYTGSTFANLYLRLKFGRTTDIVAVPFMATRLALAPQVYPGSRMAVMRHLWKLAAVSPKAFVGRRRSTARFPFRVWDYDLVRDGAFVPVDALPADCPLVTVVTRTYRGRDRFLRQCLLSVAHQTYPNIEHVVVEDGGRTAQETVEEIGRVTSRPARFVGLDKIGRSAAGNRGLQVANGRWCLFLDDDDLLFADHVEVLVAALLKDEGAVAAYSLSWEVTTDEREGGYTEISHGVPAILRQKFDYNVLRHHNYMAIQSVLFERRLFLERGGFDEDMEVLEDWMLWIRYAHGGRFAYVPKVTSLFRTPAQPAKVGVRMEAFNTAYPLAVARVEARIRALEAESLR